MKKRLIMNKRDFEHYIKGGKFYAIYNPIDKDISAKSTSKIGKKIEVYQNMLIAPIQKGEYNPRWEGQHIFMSDEIHGWFPEEDIENLEQINDFIDFPESLPVYLYKAIYTDKSTILKNFGKGDWQIPLIVIRSYSTKQDDYFKKLSNPPADEIYKAIWYGKYKEPITWEKY